MTEEKKFFVKSQPNYQNPLQINKKKFPQTKALSDFLAIKQNKTA